MRRTKRAVDAIGAVDEPSYFFDTELPGFFLRVMPTGARAWGFQYRAGSGRAAPKKRISIAAAGKVTPEQARTIARGLAADVTKGLDPAGEKARKAAEMDVTALVDLYEAEGCFVQRGVRQGEPMKAITKAYTVARLRHHVIPLLGRKKINDVGAGDVERFVRDVTAGRSAKDEKIGPRKRIIVRGGEGAARKVVRDLSAVFSFAVRRGIVGTNPCERAAVRTTDNRRERFLTVEEIGRLGKALGELEGEGVNPKAVNIARLWALTGCRRNEIAGLRWSEVDAERGLLVLDDTKTGKSVRPLSAPALAVLSTVPREGSSPFVFPATSGDGHFQGVKKVWPKAIEKAKLPGVTPHVLRHTVGGLATSSGEAQALTGALLGHANHRSTAIYAHVSRDPAKEAADRVAGAIADALANRKKLKT